MIRVRDIKLPVGRGEAQLLKKLTRVLGVSEKDILHWSIFRRSLDARKKDNILYVYVVDVEVENEAKILKKAEGKNIFLHHEEGYSLPEGKARTEQPPVVIGFGPAGMFAALIMAETGLKPIVLERGGDVESRKRAVAKFWSEGVLDEENNVQFGEGGAGTFSDGKLTTRIKDPRCRRVLEEFVQAGAPSEILYDAKPHIGTDLLEGVVRNIREKIIYLGGEVRFFSKAEDIEILNGEVQAVILSKGEKIMTKDVVLAVGHSARDTFSMLLMRGIRLEQKPFAMGVRIEHPQEMINAAQYGKMRDELPPADYRLTYTTRAGRGVYTFCMCPGGYVVAAASQEGRLAVNGMSEYKRDGKNANSALLVQVFPEDMTSPDPLAGMLFQQELEEKAFAAGGGGYCAPVETVGDFLRKGCEKREVLPTYRPKTKEADMDDIFPPFMTESLREALPAMGKKLRGFDREDALLTAVESRSSSPVRIVRDAEGESVSLKGLYPTGEGAGYAGGIVSAAVDGIRIAERIFEKYRQ